MSAYKLKTNSLGFREVYPKPAMEDLQRYYEKNIIKLKAVIIKKNIPMMN